MGACATKPKVLKDDAAPAPESAKEVVTAGVATDARKDEETEVLAVAEEEKKVVDREIGDNDGESDKVKEVVDDDKVDDQSNKRRSLSHLFKANEGKEPTESKKESIELLKQEPSETLKLPQPGIQEPSVVGNPKEEPVPIEQSAEPVKAQEQLATEKLVVPEKQDQSVIEKPLDPVKQPPSVIGKLVEPEKQDQWVIDKPLDPVKQKPSVTEKTIEVPDTKSPTAEKSEVPVEPTPAESDAPVNMKADRENESATVAETKTNETDVEKKSEETE